MLRGADVSPNVWVLATPLLLLMMAALGFGLGVIVSALTTRYRDLAVVVGFGVQLLMYRHAGDLSALGPAGALSDLDGAQPDGAGDGAFPVRASSAPARERRCLRTARASRCAILFIGMVMFNKVERTFMDTV